jgi:hypothetical protein
MSKSEDPRAAESVIAPSRGMPLWYSLRDRSAMPPARGFFIWIRVDKEDRRRRSERARSIGDAGERPRLIGADYRRSWGAAVSRGTNLAGPFFTVLRGLVGSDIAAKANPQRLRRAASSPGIDRLPLGA